MSWHSTWPARDGLLWGLGGSSTWVLLCTAFGVAGTRLGWWPDLVPSRRAHRLVLLSVSLIAGAGVWLGGRYLGAPRPLLLIAAAALLLLASVLACTCVGNISLHTSAAAGSVTLMALLMDVRWAGLYLLVAAIAWSRLHLGAHTPAQVLAGAGLGTLLCGATVYWGL